MRNVNLALRHPFVNCCKFIRPEYTAHSQNYFQYTVTENLDYNNDNVQYSTKKTKIIIRPQNYTCVFRTRKTMFAAVGDRK